MPTDTEHAGYGAVDQGGTIESRSGLEDALQNEHGRAAKAQPPDRPIDTREHFCRPQPRL